MRELKTLVAPTPPQGVLMRGHAGRVNNKRSLKIALCPVSLTMGCHGPSADLLYPECVCESTFLCGTFTRPMRIPFSRFCHDALYMGAFRLDVIRKEAWPFYRKKSGARLCWELEEPKAPEGPFPGDGSVRTSVSPL